MSRAKPNNRSHILGTSTIDEEQKKALRDTIASFGECTCRQSGAEDCAETCQVRAFVAGISGIIFEAQTLASLANPKERARNLDIINRKLQAVIDALEPKERKNRERKTIEIEGRSEDLEFFDNKTLQFFGHQNNDGLSPPSDSSAFIELLKHLVRNANAEKDCLLGKDRAAPRRPNSIPADELMRHWRECFGSLPTTYPDGVFARVLHDLRDDDPSADALQSEIKRARKQILGSTN